MSDTLSVAQSALAGLSTSMAVTANNVANATTDGYKSREAHLSTGPDGRGVQVSTIATDTSSGGVRAQTVNVSPDTAAILAADADNQAVWPAAGVGNALASGTLPSGVQDVATDPGDTQPYAALVEMSNVDLVRQSVSMAETARAFDANAAVIRTADTMAGTLLDLRV